MYDPGSELYHWEGESSASITINGMGKIKEVTCITAAVIIRYPSKVHRSTRSGPTACSILCNWSMYNFSNHRPV